MHRCFKGGNYRAFYQTQSVWLNDMRVNMRIDTQIY